MIALEAELRVILTNHTQLFFDQKVEEKAMTYDKAIDTFDFNDEDVESNLGGCVRRLAATNCRTFLRMDGRKVTLPEYQREVQDAEHTFWYRSIRSSIGGD